ALAAHEGGDFVVDAGGAEYARVAKFDQNRAFCMAGVVAGQADFAQGIGGALARTSDG
ncbi:MAG: hypothetical protein RL717_1197, partial [Pseudomonadota bacterium]